MNSRVQVSGITRTALFTKVIVVTVLKIAQEVFIPLALLGVPADRESGSLGGSPVDSPSDGQLGSQRAPNRSPSSFRAPDRPLPVADRPRAASKSGPVRQT